MLIKPHISAILLCMIILGPPLTGGATILPRMRISVENNHKHVQTKAVNRFAKDISQKLAGQIDVRFFSNASLFRDRDIIQSLAQGKVEMAVPGTWHVMQFEPNAGIFMLPTFYGREASVNYAILDSPIGERINRGIEKKLQVKILGRWLDLGHAHLFGVHRDINRHEDIKGLRVRVAGGTANKIRIQALGAVPRIIPWPDLPEHMQQNRVDAVLTSYETIRSAALWEKGVQSAFEDREYFPQYIPLIRMSFWQKLSPQIQQVLRNAWEQHVNEARQQAAEAQAQAKKILMEKGVKVVVPDNREIKKQRQDLLVFQPDFVKALHIDPELVRDMDEVLNANE